ncbi:MAG: DNA-processing protein DprA [Acidimicrobiia bacterium]
MTRQAAVRLAHGALAPRRVDELIDRFGTIDAAVDAVERGLPRLPDASQQAIRVDRATREAELLALGVEFVMAGDESYPGRLTNYDGAPRWLFVRGRMPEGPAIGIVGSRACTAYGRELAAAYGLAAVRSGWNVVSGLARGIDAAAHRGARPDQPPTSGTGRCIGVLGCGIDVVYPAENRSLHQVVAASGAIVSEYPPGIRPDAWRFPTRNRIIAGLSDIVLVVEASVTGGALITARIAIDYGVPVYAVPGDIDRSTSAGTNALIRDGAFPIFGADDLAAVLDLLAPLTQTAPKSMAGGV